MLLLSVLLSQTVHATAVPCTLEQALQFPKSPCVSQITKKIKDEKLRAEFKERFSRWKAPEKFRAFYRSGYLEAQSGGKPFVQALWLSRANPSVLWLNGQVYSGESGHAAFSRGLAADNDLVKDVVFFYSVAGDDDANKIADSKSAEAVVKSNAPMAGYLPEGNPIVNWLGGGPSVNCVSKNTVEAMNFDVNPGTDELHIRITPKSATDFILDGIEKGKTHLVSISAFQLKMGEQTRTILTPKWSFAGATIAECSDANCNKTTGGRAYQERELIFGHSPEKEKEMDAERSKSSREEIARINQDRRDRLAAKMFGMSIMGSICNDPIARKELKKNYNVNLVPASN